MVIPMSVAAGVPVQAIVRVKLAPSMGRQAFERWLQTVPMVLYAALVTGDADYEVLLGCRSFADLGDVLTQICGCSGVRLASTALVLHEVAGLGQRWPEISDEVTMPRPGSM